MDDDLEDFGKLFFTNIVLVEAKFLYGSKDLQLLIDLQLVADILKHLHDFMVIDGIISLLFLLKTSLRLLASYYFKSPIDLIQFVRNLKVNPKVFRVILHSLVLFTLLFFSLNQYGSLSFCWNHIQGQLRSILSHVWLALRFVAHKLIIYVFIKLFRLVLLLFHFIPYYYKQVEISSQSRINFCPKFHRKYQLCIASKQIQLNMKNQHLIKYKNPVILKDQEGKVKLTTFDLPPGNHSYGKKVVDDPEPIKYVVNGWKGAESSDKPNSKIKNYQELNRQAIHNKLHTAKEQTDFRKTNDLMVDVKQGQKVIPIMLPSQDFSYGVPNRPSTPMKLVMGNCYALQAEAKNQGDYNKDVEKIAGKTNSKISAKTTKSQALRQQNAEKQKSFRGKPNLQEKFKLNKFTSLGVTKVDTGIKDTKKQV